MTDLPTETLDGFAAWHPDHGFMIHSPREFPDDVAFMLGSKKRNDGWRVVPVTITLTATGTDGGDH